MSSSESRDFGTRRGRPRHRAGRRRYNFAMRIFIGIDLDDEIRGKIARFLEGVSGFAPGRPLGAA